MLWNVRIGLLVLFALNVLFSANANNSNSITFFKNSGIIELTGQVKYLKNPPPRRDILEIVKTPPSAWTLIPSAIPWLPTGNYSVWFHFKVQNTTDQPIYLNLPYPFLDKIDLFISINDSSEWKMYGSGFLRPSDARALPIHSYNFQVALPGQTVDCYLNIENSWVILPIFQLATAEQLYQLENKHNIWQGLYIGIMLAFFVYNLILFILLREKVYAFYLLYLLSAFLISSHHAGITCHQFWPCDRWIFFDLVVNICIGPSTILFAQSFLQLEKYTPRFNLVLTGLTLTYIPYLFLFYFPETKLLAGKLLEVNNTILPFLFLGSGLYVFIWKKYRPAFYYLTGWMVFLVASVILFRIYGGHIRYNPIIFNVLEMGSAVEAMLFSLALADRIRVLRKEKVLAENAKNEKQREMELQALSNERQLLETEIKTQELERARIAADLHDELGLTLSLTKISIEQAAKHASLNYLNQAKSNVDLSITRLREITHNLHPSVVNTFGLATVMRRMLDNMSSRYEMKISYQIDVNISLPAATEIHIYRILNELINNVIKHANATKMEVTFEKVLDERCRLTVTDDGIGIPKDKNLRSISARMQIIHGKYEIRQPDGTGTQIIVSFPILPK